MNCLHAVQPFHNSIHKDSFREHMLSSVTKLSMCMWCLIFGGKNFIIKNFTNNLMKYNIVLTVVRIFQSKV